MTSTMITNALVDQYVASDAQISQILKDGAVTVAELRQVLRKKPELFDGVEAGYGLMTATLRSRMDYAQLLLDEFGADVNSEPDGHGITSLCIAVQTKRMDMIRFLIENGANVNLKCDWNDWHGRSPLEMYPELVGPILREYQQKLQQVDSLRLLLNESKRKHMQAVAECNRLNKEMVVRKYPYVPSPQPGSSSTSEGGVSIDGLTVTGVRELLATLGLSQYGSVFAANEINGLALKTLTDADLKNELGVTVLSHRRTILAKVQAMTSK